MRRVHMEAAVSDTRRPREDRSAMLPQAALRGRDLDSRMREQKPQLPQPEVQRRSPLLIGGANGERHCAFPGAFDRHLMGACRSPLNLETQRPLRQTRPRNNPRHVFAHDRLDGRTRHRQLEAEADEGRRQQQDRCAQSHGREPSHVIRLVFWARLRFRYRVYCISTSGAPPTRSATSRLEISSSRRCKRAPIVRLLPVTMPNPVPEGSLRNDVPPAPTSLDEALRHLVSHPYELLVSALELEISSAQCRAARRDLFLRQPQSRPGGRFRSDVDRVELSRSHRRRACLSHAVASAGQAGLEGRRGRRGAHPAREPQCGISCSLAARHRGAQRPA